MNRVSKFFAVVGLASAAMISASSMSSAATFDFVALAAGNEGVFTGTTVSGINLTAGASGNAQSVAYLDDLSGGLPGGLGVCSSGIVAGECYRSTDDNTGFTGDLENSGQMETLNISFDREVTILGFSFNNRDHGALDMQKILIGGIEYTTSAAGTLGTAIVLAANTILTLTHDKVIGDVNATKARDFYLSSLNAISSRGGIPLVPVPAALPLMLGALAGLGVLARRRKQKTDATA